MTHNELITVLNDYDTGLSNGMVHKDLVLAIAKTLRAVVELHYQDDYQNCQECKQGLDPCLTIQTIEKELS